MALRWWQSCWGCRNLYQGLLNMVHCLRRLCLNAALIFLCSVSIRRIWDQRECFNFKLPAVLPQVPALLALILVLMFFGVFFWNCVKWGASLQHGFWKLYQCRSYFPEVAAIFPVLMCCSFIGCTFPLVQCECTNTACLYTQQVCNST